MRRAKAEEHFAQVRSAYEEASTKYEAYQRRRDEEAVAMFRNLDFAGDVYELFGDSLEDERYNMPKNIVRPQVKSAVNARLQAIPNPEVSILQDSTVAEARSRLTEKLLRSLTYGGVLNVEEQIRLHIWSAICGLGFLKLTWDPDAGPERQRDDLSSLLGGEVDEEVDEFGAPIKAPEMEGEIDVEFVPTTDMLPDPMARSWREVRYVFHRKLRPLEQVKDIFGDEDYFGQPITASEQDPQGRSMEHIVNDGYTPKGDSEKNKSVEIVEFWEPRTPKYPNGRLMIWAGSQLIHYGPNPFQPARIPFVPFYGDNVVPLRLIPDGVVEDLKPLQNAVNFLQMKTMEFADLAMNGRMLVPDAAEINYDSIDNRSGGLVRYSGGQKPEWMQTPEIPNSWFTYGAELEEAAKFVSGYYDITRGNMPGGDISGRAIAFATEREKAQQQIGMALFRRSMQEVYKQFLQLAKQFYDDGRVIRLIGENDRWQLMAFNRETFDVDADVIVEPFGNQPSSKALRDANVMEMFQAGMFEDTPGASRARGLMSDNSIARVMPKDPTSVDKERVRREHLAFLKSKGDEVFVDEADDHGIHLEEHRSFKLSTEFEALDPQEKQLFENHLEEHEAYQVMQEMEMQGWDQPAPSAGGSPPQPAGVESPLDGGQAPGVAPEPPIEQYVEDNRDVATQEQG